MVAWKIAIDYLKNMYDDVPFFERFAAALKSRKCLIALVPGHEWRSSALLLRLAHP